MTKNAAAKENIALWMGFRFHNSRVPLPVPVGEWIPSRQFEQWYRQLHHPKDCICHSFYVEDEDGRLYDMDFGESQNPWGPLRLVPR